MDWFELGSLLVQCAMLATLAWYGRKILRTLTAFYEQNEAPQMPAPSNATVDRGAATAPIAYHAGGLASAWRDIVGWLQAPMARGSVAPWRRAITWFRAPIGS